MSDEDAADSSPATNPTVPIWVVSLDAATARIRFVKDGFATADLDFTRFEATDGFHLNASELAATSQLRALFDTGRMLSRGELGCALSHLRVYERMLDEGIDMLLVMEDDAVPLPDLRVMLRSLDALPDDWDVVTFRSQFASSTPVQIDDRVVAGAHSVCRYEKPPFGAQCYLIRSSAARRLLDVGYPVRLPADELLFRRRPAGLRVYGVEPPLAVEGPLASESVARPVAHDSTLLSNRLVAGAVVVAGKVVRRVRRASDRVFDRRLGRPR